MKKIISILLSMTLLIGVFTGCQTVKSEETKTNTTEVTENNAEKEINDDEKTGDSTGTKEVVWDENLLDPNNPVTVKFYSYSAASPQFGTGFQTLLDNFNNGPGKEKGVIVEYVMDDNQGTKVKADVKAGQQVDMLQGSFSNLGVYIEDLGLKTYEESFPQEVMDEHFEGIPENALELGVINDKMYSLAFTFSTPMLYMNSTLLEEAGLDPHTPPKDWEEMYDMSKKIKENTGKYGLCFSETNSSGWITASVLKSNGAEALSEDGKEVQFATDEGIEAFEIWKKFYQDGVGIGGTDTDVREVLIAGNGAFMINSTALYSTVKNAFDQNGWTLDGYPMPGFDGNPSIPTNSGAGILVRPDSKQKAQAIWEVIKYYTGNEGFTIVTSEIGYLPLRPNLIEDDNYLKTYVEENPMIGRNIERLPLIERGPIWRGNRAAELKQAYLDMSAKALTTDSDVRETMEEYQNLMNNMLQE